MTALGDVLDRLAPVLGAVGGEPEPLDGGITNRNYRAVLGGRRYVIRLPSPGLELLGIDRATERACAARAGAEGIGPRLAAVLGADCLVTEWVDAAPVTAGAVPERAVDGLAALLRAVHAGPHRAHGFDAVALAERQLGHARRAGVPVPEGIDEGLAAARRARDRIGPHPDHAPRPCHNDLLGGNVLWDGRRVWLVDWDYAAEGDPFFDLGHFAQSCALGPAAEHRLLRAYFGAEPDERRLRALSVMKLLADLREAMWGVVQQSLSELDFDYAGYAEQHAERLRAALPGLDAVPG